MFWLVRRETTSRSVASAASTQREIFEFSVKIFSVGELDLWIVATDSATAIDFTTSSYMDMNPSIVGKGFPAFDVEQRCENMLQIEEKRMNFISSNKMNTREYTSQ